MLAGVTVVNTNIAEKFRDFMENGRIIMFEAPCGFGKTTLAKRLLRDYNVRVCELRADEADFDALPEQSGWDVMLLEDLQFIQSSEEYQSLCAFIRANPKKRFVFTSRGVISGELIPFRISGLLTEIEEDEMFFDRQLAAEFFAEYGVHLSETELNAVIKNTLGYPLAIEMLAEKLAAGAVYNSKLSDEIKQGIYQYYDEMIFCRFDLPARRFLLELAPFESFNTELAKMVSGDADAGKIIARLRKSTRMFRSAGDDSFYFWEIFRGFLMWEQNIYYTDEQKKALCSRGGLYYELHSDYARALEFYSKSGETGKVSELMIKIIGLHPGMGYYEELESYYLSLPDEVIAQSPALMQGKSMMCALCADYDGSEKWYNTLREFAAARKHSDAAAKEARSRLAWLDISLPQRGGKRTCRYHRQGISYGGVQGNQADVIFCDKRTAEHYERR